MKLLQFAHHLILLCFVLASVATKGQHSIIETPLTIDTTDAGPPHPSAILDLKSQTQGFLLPRMTALERIEISSPQTGLLVYDDDVRSLYYFDGDDWVEFGSGRRGIRDKDFDTSIKVEEAVDEDVVRIDAGGSERLVISENSIDVKNDMRHTNLGDMAGAGENNALSEDNTVYGYSAGNATFTGSRNIFIGTEAGNDLPFGSSSSNNVFIGYKAGDQTTAASSSILIGANAGNNTNEILTDIIAIGGQAGGKSPITVNGLSKSIAIGEAAGQDLGSRESIAIGSMVGSQLGVDPDVSYENCIMIGTEPPENSGVLFRKFSIGVNGVSPPLLHGDFDSGVLTIDDKLGINATEPGSELHVLHVNTATDGGFTIENENNGNSWRMYTTSGTGSLRFYSTEGGNGTNDYVAFVNDATGTWNTNSDRRVKEEIGPTPNILHQVNRLEVVNYLFKREHDRSIPHIGFIAQDVEPLFPGLVQKDEGGLYSLSYSEIGPIAIKAIQELSAKNDHLEEANRSLRKDLNSMMNRLEEIQSQLKLLLDKE